MKKKLKFYGIDFADSRYKSLKTTAAELIVDLEAWDEKTIRIFFKHPIQFFYKCGDLGGDLYQLDESPVVTDAVKDYYEKMPEEHPYKLFQICDIQDIPFIEVVAEQVVVEEIES